MKRINVWLSDVEKKKVPPFFKEIWAQRHGSTIEDNEALYKKCEVPQNRAYTIAIIAAVAAVICFVLFVVPLSGPKQKLPILPYGWGWVLVPVAILIISWNVGDMLAPEKKEIRWHHREYIDAVEILFRLFQIEPSVELGQMSREEFIKGVAGSLRTRARAVEEKEGFERAALMDDWKAMHKCALWWGLCDEEYTKYFPPKGKPITV